MKMSRQWIAISGVVVAVIAVAFSVFSYVSGLKEEFGDCKLENAELRAEIASLKAVGELTGKYHNLVGQLVQTGRVSIQDVTPFLPRDEVEKVSEKAFQTLSLPMSVDAYFYPSGWIGDGEEGEKYLTYKQLKDYLKISYSPGPKGWAGICWQFPDGNWGNQPGRNLTGAQKLTFRARGETGREVIQFKSGGITGKTYEDSFEKSIGWVALSSYWTEYVIDLRGLDLSNVIGAFAWIASQDRNRDHVITFYLKDLIIE